MKRLVRTAIALSLGGAALAIPPARAHAMRSVRFGRGSTSATRTEPKSTIDDDVQRAVREAFVRVHAARGSAIVMEAGTGRLIVDYEHGNASNYRDVQNPGFTFVPFAIVAGEEYSASYFEVDHTCDGHFAFGIRQWDCNNDVRAHGDHVQVIDALRAHCYGFFYEAALGLTYQPFWKTVRTFGFGQTTGARVDNESSGRFASRKELAAIRGYFSMPLMLRGMTGYETIEVTPMQLAVGWSALVNGGHRVVPDGLAHRSTHDESRDDAVYARRESLVRVLGALEDSAIDPRAPLVGLDARPFEIDDRSDFFGVQQNWFAGYFPRSHPRYVVVVRITEAKDTDTRARQIATDAMNAMH